MVTVPWRSVMRALALALAAAVASCGGSGAPSGSVGGTPLPVASAPKITQQPVAVSVNEGGAATFSVSASADGNAPISYQWQRNGQDVPGATASSLTLNPARIADSGVEYRVVISNSLGTVTSASAVLTVTAKAPTVDLQPASSDVTEGASVTLRAHALGTGPLRYQWYRAGIAIANATSDSLTIGQARYSDDGVAYTVEVSNAGATVSSSPAALQVRPSTPVQPVSACAEITAPGSYRLAADISPASALPACLYVHDTHDVQIDCAGHALSGNVELIDAIRIERVDHFSLKSCTITTSSFWLTKSSWGSIRNNSLTSNSASWPIAVINAINVDHIVFDHNSMVGTFSDRYANSDTISNNQFKGNPGHLDGAAIMTSISTHTRVTNNTIDGGWSGNAGVLLGHDDGIIVADASDALIENNTISNVWDCGVEWENTVTDSIIRNNTIDRTGYCAIGGWYWASVSNVQIRQNKASRVPALFQMFRLHGLRRAGSDEQASLAADTEVRFRDNIFDGNVIVGPADGATASYIPVYDQLGYRGDVSPTAGEQPVPKDAFKIGNNVFRNNDFGAGVAGPNFGVGAPVAGYIVDGGGNKCVRPATANYPLQCN